MKAAITYLSKQSPVNLAIAGGVVLVVIYVVGRAAVTEVANVAAGVISGNNAVTQNQHNADGETVTAYQDAGVLGTLGAVANSASGGLLASTGEKLGGWLFDIFGPKLPK